MAPITAGDWVVGKTEQGDLAVSAKKTIAADVSVSWIVALVMNGAPGDRPATKVANANLLAAAPKLAAAVKRLTRNGVCTCTDGGEGFVCDQCEGLAALRLAEGR